MMCVGRSSTVVWPKVSPRNQPSALSVLGSGRFSQHQTLPASTAFSALLLSVYVSIALSAGRRKQLLYAAEPQTAVLMLANGIAGWSVEVYLLYK